MKVKCVKFGVGVLWGLCGVLSASRAEAQFEAAQLRDASQQLKLVCAKVVWVPNVAGGTTPMALYELQNMSNRWLPIPVTQRGGAAGHYVGTGQHWIQRLGRDWKIPAIPRNIATRGPKHARQYADGGTAITTDPWIAPGQVLRFAHLIPIGGFPSGLYSETIEFESLEGRVLQSVTVKFFIP
ncbi:MAG: hypothetical protein ACKV0T_00205 [Planctomycetales bacterium]